MKDALELRRSIYEYVFSSALGGQQQVRCCFHDDEKASAGIRDDGAYHCFTCGVSAKDDISFIAQYFSVEDKQAISIRNHLDIAGKRTYINKPITNEQRTYLNNCGIIDSVIDKYFIMSPKGNLLCKQMWNGLDIGATWFNSPLLSNHNAGKEKYVYDNSIGGWCTPYDDVQLFNKLLICEGEKDMLTAKSLGIKQAVAKLGGANTPILTGINFNNKEVIICYDCDDAGRTGAHKDAIALVTKCNCKVKVLDLGLNDKEDLNDYFMKYKHSLQDFYNLIKSTPEFVVSKEDTKTKMELLWDSLSTEDKTELKNIIKGE